MDGHESADRRRRFLETVAGLVPAMADEADREDGAPLAALAALRNAGALTAALPPAHGGLDLGCGRQGRDAARFWRLLGQGSVAVGRLIEGHVNALRLVFLHGAEADRTAVAADAASGCLFGLWVTDGARPLAVRDGGLAGEKAFCSGAALADRALVTAADHEGRTSMWVIPTADGRRAAPRLLSGVRGAVTADMAFDRAVAVGAPIGAPGDYLRQPEFSAGAWRGSAIAAGALEALAAGTIASLRARGRHRDPHQAARLGRLMIARDTATMWVDRLADAADDAEPRTAHATVNLGRLAVEAACLEALVLSQRSVGLQAFAAGSRLERIGRDLATYLRQPAPDETLTEAAILFAERA